MGSGRFHGLDGVRAIAVAAVLLYHGDVSWMPGGFLGVEVFFVLSGFLITSLLWSELRDDGVVGLRAFWARRARRLLPALFVMLLTVTGAFMLGWPEEIARIRGDVVAGAAYASNWYLISTDHSYFTAFGRPSPFGHLWSLAIEEQFYVVWPVLLVAMAAVLRRRPRLVAATILGGAAASAGLMWLLYSAADPSRVYYGTDTRLAGLLLGAALGIAWKPGGRHGRAFDALAVAAIGVLGAAFVRFGEFSAFTYRPGIQIVALASAALIAACVHPGSRAGAVLGSRPLRAIGLRSYGIYLWHWPVFAVTRPELDLPLAGWPVLGIRVALTLALAEISYRFVEVPARAGAYGDLVRRIRVIARRSKMTQRRVAFAWGSIGLVGVLGFAVLVGGVVTALPPVSPLATIAGGRIVTIGLDENEHANAATPRTPASRTHVLVVGDSVLIEAAPAVRRRLGVVSIDAAVGRQVNDAVARLAALRKVGRIPPVVVIHLGTNGLFTPAQFDQMMRILADRKVVFVTPKVPRRWERSTNQTIANGVRRYPNAWLVDWHSRWRTCRAPVFWADGVHVTPGGAACYAELIAASI